MSILPESLDISGGVTFEKQPSLTWFINKDTNRIQGTVEDFAAVRQAVEIILNTERFRWQIYKPYSGMQWDGLIGQDPGYVALELKRRVTEALMVDDRITGVSDVPIGSRFSTINGSDSINFCVTAAMEAEHQYQLTAETAGSIGNAYAGAILPITSIPGLTSAQITDILVPGDDEETDESLRSRLISALNERPFGGNIAAYQESILAIDGVGAVQVYPTWNGAGTVKCSIMGADYLPASSTLVENVQNAIDPAPNQGLGLGLAPIGAKVSIVSPTKVTVNISASVTLAAGYTLDQVESKVKSALEEYLLSVRKEWGNQLGTTEVEYAANVYISRVLAAIVGTSGIVNAINCTLNSGTEDLILTENGTVQQVPVLGTVTLSA